MQVWVGPLTESEFRNIQTQVRIHRELLQMPPESHAALLFSLEPVGEKVPTFPDGQRTAMVIVDDSPLPRVWTVPTEKLKGGKGLNFELFGRLVEPGTEGPIWTIALKSGRPEINFQPWRIRAYKPGSPLVAQILWTPELNRVHKNFDWTGDWDGKAYDDWQRSAGLAMEFLHDFERNVVSGRTRLEDDPGWRATMLDIEDYLKKPGTSLESAVKRHWDLLVDDLNDDDLDDEAKGIDVEERRRKAALGKLKRWRSRWKKLPESKKKADFT